MPYVLGPGRVHAGRSEGIKRVRADRFNLLGPWSDDRTGTAAVKTRHVESTPASFGQFKTPSLRNLGHTAPYMHDGRYATLRDVVRHYSDLAAESDDLVVFLESLTDPGAARVPTAPVVEGCRP